jgi:hypothetical protein
VKEETLRSIRRLNGYHWAKIGQCLRPDAVHALELLNLLEGTLGRAVLDDACREGRTDAV